MKHFAKSRNVIKVLLKGVYLKNLISNLFTEEEKSNFDAQTYISSEPATEKTYTSTKPATEKVYLINF